MNTPLDLTQHGFALELTLNRPECRNALSRELIRALREALRHAADAPGVRCVILTGAPPAFCAGLDLREVVAGNTTVYDATPLLELYEQMDALPKPVLAAVNGPAVAGGAGLLTACDLVICGESARVGYPGIRQGLVAPLLVPYLVRAVGERRARYLLLTGELLTAAQAVAFGLANELVSDHELLWRVRQIAAGLAEHPPEAVRRMKRVFQDLRVHGEAQRAGALRELLGTVVITDRGRADQARTEGL
jgi:methylglutaconyl-CoA hydratase